MKLTKLTFIREDGAEIALSYEDAQSLYHELRELFREQPPQQDRMIPTNPVNPWYPPYPIITCNTSYTESCGSEASTFRCM